MPGHDEGARTAYFGAGVECTAMHFQPPSSTHTASATDSTIFGTPPTFTSMRRRQCTSAALPAIDTVASLGVMLW